VWHHIRGSFHK